MRLWPGVALALGLAATVACMDTTGSTVPNFKYLYVILPGNDTVKVDTESGDVTPGPITIFGDTDFGGEFWTADGFVDPRVSGTAYRLDVTPANTGLVTFERLGPFSGTLHKVAQGSTTAQFSLVRLADAVILFNTSVPIEIL